MGTITAIVSDTHIGGATGLCLPVWFLDGNPKEKKEIRASIAQMWLHDNWNDYWDYVKSLAGVRGKYRKHRIVTLALGDFVDGYHHNTIQALPNVDDQINMAAEIFTQVAALSDGGVYACIGTEPTHAGANGAYERQIFSRCGFKMLEQELRLNIDGTEILAYHHGRAGRRQWSSSAAGVAADTKLQSLDMGLPVPRYVFAGHNHLIDDSGEKVPGCRAVSLPSWQLRTGFGYRVASGQRSDIGGLIILPDGSLDWSKSRYKADTGDNRSITI